MYTSGKRKMSFIHLLYYFVLLGYATSIEAQPSNLYCHNVNICRCQATSEGLVVICNVDKFPTADALTREFDALRQQNITYLSRVQLDRLARFPLPVELLDGISVQQLVLNCPNSNVSLVPIYTAAEVRAVIINKCNLQETDFSFLGRFASLDKLRINLCIMQSFNNFPYLPTLSDVALIDTSPVSWYPPSSTPNLQSVQLNGVGQNNSNNLLSSLTYYTDLTSLTLMRDAYFVPSQVKHFPNLQYLTLGNSPLFILSSGSLHLNSTLKRLDVSYPTYIHSTAFKGNYSSTTIVLRNAKLTAFDEAVFGPLLSAMYKKPGSIFFQWDANFNSSVKCDCSIAWLIVNNRNFLTDVRNGKCSNSTAFVDLDPSAFHHCTNNATTSTFPTTTVAVNLTSTTSRDTETIETVKTTVAAEITTTVASTLETTTFSQEDEFSTAASTSTTARETTTTGAPTPDGSTTSNEQLETTTQFQDDGMSTAISTSSEGQESTTTEAVTPDGRTVSNAGTETTTQFRDDDLSTAAVTTTEAEETTTAEAATTNGSTASHGETETTTQVQSNELSTPADTTTVEETTTTEAATTESSITTNEATETTTQVQDKEPSTPAATTTEVEETTTAEAVTPDSSTASIEQNETTTQTQDNELSTPAVTTTEVEETTTAEAATTVGSTASNEESETTTRVHSNESSIPASTTTIVQEIATTDAITPDVSTVSNEETGTTTPVPNELTTTSETVTSTTVQESTTTEVAPSIRTTITESATTEASTKTEETSTAQVHTTTVVATEKTTTAVQATTTTTSKPNTTTPATTIASTPTPPNVNCPANLQNPEVPCWPLAGTCYCFSKYKQTWYNTIPDCNKLAGRPMKLLSFENPAEQQLIVNHIRNTAELSEKITSFWTSGNDVDTEGNWKWRSTGKPVTFSNWAIGQPDNAGGEEDCLLVNLSNTWEDHVCWKYAHFICEENTGLP